MKHTFLLFAMLIAFKFSYAQWTGTNPVTTSSNVGIGTTNPTEALSVDGGTNHGKIFTAVPFADAILKMYRWTGTGTTYYPWYLATGRPNGGFSIMYGSPANVGSETNMTDALFIGNNGYVGVGTTSPIGNLDLRGNFFVGTNDFIIGSTGSNIQIDQGSSTGNSSSRIRAFSHGGTQVDNLALQSSGGNVGIGTDNPAYKLHVEGGSAYINQDNLSAMGGQLTISNNYGNQNGAVRLNFNNGGAVSWIKGLVTGPNTNTGSALVFGVPSNTADGTERMRIDASGNVGIGTITPDEKLSVNGTIHSKKVRIDLTNLPDYVFKSTYNLLPLSEVKAYIDQNQHLPEVPSATTVEKEGMDVGEMNKILLKKVEELTLYLIDLKKENDENKKEINALKNKITGK